MNSFLLISALVTSYLCSVEGRSKETFLDDYPWLALIEYEHGNTTKLSCGGALISDRYVLTAGYCVVGPLIKYGRPRNVRLGEYDVSNGVDQPDCIDYECTKGAVVIPIEKTITQPDYSDSKSKGREIALIKMSESAPYSDFIRPISLPTSDINLSPPSGAQLIEAGWRTALRDKTSNVKMAVKRPFVPLSECQTAYTNYKVELWQGQFCAGGEEGSCQGDGGGPLVWKNGNGGFEVVGIVSFGATPCGKHNTPDVYTNVYQFNSWIRDTIGL